MSQELGSGRGQARQFHLSQNAFVYDRTLEFSLDVRLDRSHGSFQPGTHLGLALLTLLRYQKAFFPQAL